MRDNTERLILLEHIADAEYKLAKINYQEVTEEAEPYVVNGEMIPDDLRFRFQDAHKKLVIARDKWEDAADNLRNLTMNNAGRRQRR